MTIRELRLSRNFAGFGRMSRIRYLAFWLRVVIAGDAIESGQKVHNLRTAVANVDPKTEVLVFVDTDARPHASWLRSLVAPLRR